MDKELIAGLSNLSESLDRIAEVLSRKEEPKSATAMALKMGEFDKQIVEISKNVKGVFFHIGGDVATAYQFFATDSTQHFLRAALYFETTPNEDSLAPIHQYLLKDMQHMVNTLRWK